MKTLGNIPPPSVGFGLGLVSLGRRWGFHPSPLPSGDEAQQLLRYAVDLGISVFDTAPAYGSSEKLTGEFLRTLRPDERQRLTIATKCGEHWDPNREATWVDHSKAVLEQSVSRSLELLGTIDVLQLHKTTAAVLRSPDVWRVLDRSRALGIRRIGASVSDLDAGRLACEIDAINLIQVPYNPRFSHLEPLIEKARECGKQVWTNRPFASGAMIHEDPVPCIEAYRFVLKQRFAGAILTGSVNRDHIREDWHDFHRALALR